MPRFTIEQRFWKKVAFTQAGCWAWMGKTCGRGYGVFAKQYTPTKMILAHRMAWELSGKELPVYTATSLQLDHRCRNRLCVRPSHLALVTSRENTMRGDGVTKHNAAKSHCKHGHPFNEENTRIRKNGDRECRTCRRAYEKKRRPRIWKKRPPAPKHDRLLPGLKLVCRRGHPLVGENVWIPPSEPRHRYCKICRSEVKRRHNKKKREHRRLIV